MSTGFADVIERRAVAEQRIAELREQRGQALADGLPFDDSTITAAEGELERIEDVAGEVERRARGAMASAAEQRRAEIIARLHEAEAERRAALRQAEKSCREIAAALVTFHSVSAAIGKDFAALGKAPPLGFNSATEVSLHVGAILYETLPHGRSGRYGRITFGSRARSAQASWPEVFAADVDAITAKKEPIK